MSRVNKGRLDIVRDVGARTSHPLPSFSHSQPTMYLYLSHPTLSVIVLRIYVLLFLLSKKTLTIHTDHVVQIKKTPTAQRDTKPLTGRTPPRTWRPSSNSKTGDLICGHMTVTRREVAPARVGTAFSLTIVKVSHQIKYRTTNVPRSTLGDWQSPSDVLRMSFPARKAKPCSGLCSGRRDCKDKVLSGHIQHVKLEYSKTTRPLLSVLVSASTPRGCGTGLRQEP